MMHSLACVLALALLASPAEATPGPVDYVAVGASDAVGVGARPPGDGYVFLIRRALDARSGAGALVNLGISGARVGEIAAAVARYLQAGPRPDLATVWVGANDLVSGAGAGAFERELAGLLGQLAEAPAGSIVVANLPDLTRLPVFRGEAVPTVTPARLEAFNDAIARQAAAHGARLVDLSAERVEDDLVASFDGFHPSTAGHRVLADRFLEVIRTTQGSD